MSKVLITGGNGFIGRKLCSKLSFSGRKIKKLVRKIKENDSSEQYIYELGVDQVPEDVFDDVDTVFHLVGVTHDINNTSMTDKLYYDVNVTATEQLAITAAKKGVKGKPETFVIDTDKEPAKKTSATHQKRRPSRALPLWIWAVITGLAVGTLIAAIFLLVQK